MYWPGTDAAVRDRAGLDAQAAVLARAPRVEAGQPLVPVRGPQAARPVSPAVAGAVRLPPPRQQVRSLPCTGDPDLFFAEAPDDVEAAKALCGGCPARAHCLTGALERQEPWGVWGGELVLRGVVVPRKRPRGRPRKTEVAA